MNLAVVVDASEQTACAITVTVGGFDTGNVVAARGICTAAGRRQKQTRRLFVARVALVNASIPLFVLRIGNERPERTMMCIILENDVGSANIYIGGVFSSACREHRRRRGKTCRCHLLRRLWGRGAVAITYPLSLRPPLCERITAGDIYPLGLRHTVALDYLGTNGNSDISGASLLVIEWPGQNDILL